MESGDWKDDEQRQMIVNKIMDIFKKHLPFSAYERLQELKKIAERVEEEVYTAATSQVCSVLYIIYASGGPRNFFMEVRNIFFGF
ncbi:putative coactivator CBP, KIX domain superfamily, mediator complex subunit 15, KIX [Helianthus annuus]|nr:putative coactivator CBP, KIX domain superfamily, mediator complex subunit 15, KIX [Helianthus annuus]KAJ0774698.1 putative coactivator CBP, KIX domain superfamily, mediator complex subunit 15, KIX [Helianthus annuus]KAJ0818103.1 putative coactivator CBP, KIX domain superfamily, mediator complex subunit 15, KIX [Helianthus annuus]